MSCTDVFSRRPYMSHGLVYAGLNVRCLTALDDDLRMDKNLDWKLQCVNITKKKKHKRRFSSEFRATNAASKALKTPSRVLRLSVIDNTRDIVAVFSPGLRRLRVYA